MVTAVSSTPTRAQNFWQKTNWDLGPAYALAIDVRGIVFAGSMSHGVLRSSNNGDSWESVNNGIPPEDSSVVSLAFARNGDLLAAIQGSTNLNNVSVYRSADNGGSWRPSNAGLKPFSVGSIARSPNGTLFMDNVDDGIFRSTDDGRTWTVADTGLPRGALGNPAWINVEAIAIDSNGIIFAKDFPKGLYVSSDNGDTWTARNLPATQSFVEVDAGPDNALYGATSYDPWHSLDTSTQYGLQRSTDQGATWIKIDSFYGASNAPISSIAFNARNDIIFGIGQALNNFLTARSRDGGRTWENISSGLHDINYMNSILSIDALACRSDGELFAAGWGGVFRSTISSLSVMGEAPPSLPSSEQNALNPAELSFTLTESTFASLRIYDAAGREIRAIQNEWEPGTHPILTQGLHLPERGRSSGAYYYCLSGSDFVRSGRFILIP